jgi:hypothetical protein
VEVTGMDRDRVARNRAETHLRRIAEAELREASGPGRQPRPSGGQRAGQVAQVLRAVDAIDQVTVDALLADLELALTVRRPAEQPSLASGSGRRRMAGSVSGSGAVSYSGFASGASSGATSHSVSASVIVGPSMPSGAAPSVVQEPPAPVGNRVLPVGLMIPVAADDTSGELYLMAYAQSAGGALFSMHARIHEQPSPGATRVPGHPPGMQLLSNLTATDEAGVSYALSFSGGGSNGEWSGQLGLFPDPPPGIRWLDLTAPGGSVTRVSLDSTPPPACTVTESRLSVGEQLLHRMAVQLLVRRPAGRLDDVVEALILADVLSPLSPVPGQLAALCDQLGYEHGIPPAPGSELPEEWRSVLDHRGTPGTGPGFAALAAAFPELDGSTLTLLGLHSTRDETILHIRVTGRWEPTDHYLTTLPLLLWLRDDSGGWHAVGGSGGWSTSGDEINARMSVVPPLPHSATLEVIATGLSAQAQLTMPLHWGKHRSGGGPDVV